jgi:Helicase associated domain
LVASDFPSYCNENPTVFCFFCCFTGFVWATERSKKQDEDWNARLEQLREYKEAHKDCLVPHGYKVDPSFAEWVHRQRTTYAIHLKEGRVNPMVEGRMKKLEEMGFNFVRVLGCVGRRVI